ncbi:hypothetical protein K492DRAFT_173491 [Lichtheimia hyalospora FSU 10163]|nr:hypothetical protein K492DRAFT_173491 [Lichtheimia hyalospora FSU 10163]
MSSIDEIGYPPHRISTPNNKPTRYVQVKGPTKSPPPLLMPKPVHAVAPTQKLVQQQQKQTSSTTTTTATSTSVTATRTTSILVKKKPSVANMNNHQQQQQQQQNHQHQPQQQQQQQPSSSMPPVTSTLAPTLHPQPTTTVPESHQSAPATSVVNTGKQPVAGNKVTFEAGVANPHHHDSSSTAVTSNNANTTTTNILSNKFSAEYQAIIQQNEMLRHQVQMLTREKLEMERERHVVVDRLEQLEREMRKHCRIAAARMRNQQQQQPDMMDDPMDESTGANTQPSNINMTHSRSDPTTLLSPRRRRSTPSNSRPTANRQGHSHRHHHARSKSVPRDEAYWRVGPGMGNIRGNNRARYMDDYYEDSGASYDYYSQQDDEEDSEIEGWPEDEEDEDEDDEEDDYRRPRHFHHPPRRRRSLSSARVPPPPAPPMIPRPTAAAAAAIPPMVPPHPRYPPMMAPPPPMTMAGSLGRNPNRRSVRQRRSGSLGYSSAPRWRGGNTYGAPPPIPPEDDYMWDQYEDDYNDYPPPPRYNRRSAGRSRYF